MGISMTERVDGQIVPLVQWDNKYDWCMLTVFWHGMA